MRRALDVSLAWRQLKSRGPRCNLLFGAAALIYNEQRNGYYPSVYMNDFWLLTDKLVPLNASVPALNLTIALAPMSLMKWQMQVQVRVPSPFPRCR